jgi:uncharacterized protein YwbE
MKLGTLVFKKLSNPDFLNCGFVKEILTQVPSKTCKISVRLLREMAKC